MAQWVSDNQEAFTGVPPCFAKCASFTDPLEHIPNLSQRQINQPAPRYFTEPGDEWKDDRALTKLTRNVVALGSSPHSLQSIFHDGALLHPGQDPSAFPHSTHWEVISSQSRGGLSLTLCLLPLAANSERGPAKTPPHVGVVNPFPGFIT